jgi:hypothetical protein
MGTTTASGLWSQELEVGHHLERKLVPSGWNSDFTQTYPRAMDCTTTIACFDLNLPFP